ncbi:hypothetical protein B0H21DRAFT_382456 [Amylocystis lapponica]|nr:hypothetical protein B0H21DRAFT_382456 [Amylocystis lapponica]
MQQMMQQQQQQQQQQQKRRSFITGVANVMQQRNVPLPPALTGVPYPPNYDPSSSPWKSLDVADIGVVRLAGKEVDLYKLWALALQAGGAARATQQGSWALMLTHLHLPEHFPVPQANGQTSVAHVLAQYYLSLIGPFEEAYRRNLHQQQQQQQQQRALLAGRVPPGASQHTGNPQGRPGGTSGLTGALPGQVNALPGSAGSATHLDMGQPIATTSTQSLDSSLAAQGSNHIPPQTLPQTPQPPSYRTIRGTSVTPDARAGQGPLAGSDPLLATPSMSQRPSSSTGNIPFPSTQDMGGPDPEQDSEPRKRKLTDSEESETKRARVKTGGSEPAEAHPSTGPTRSSVPPAGASSNPSTPVGATLSRSQRQPSRRKIEYIPFAREVDTAGGRDLEAIQNESARASHRPFKGMDHWGRVDVNAVTMSLRSRISTELSYGLTTFTLLTQMRGNHKDAGFPIVQCPDLLDEVLDLLEDIAFDATEDEQSSNDADDLPLPRIRTHRELVNALIEDETRPFSALHARQGAKDPNLGPRQRPAVAVLAIMNILRNLSVAPENQEHLAKHARLLPIMFRLCSLARSDPSHLPTPASPVLSLSDLLAVRKDAVYFLVNCASFVSFSQRSPDSDSKSNIRDVRRAFELLSSFVTDQTEAVSPFTCVLQSGIPPAVHQPHPPYLADLALEAFTRLIQPDETRKILSQAIPREWLWGVMEALVHRLPVSDHDFKVVMRDVWISYIEKIVMMIYSLAFLAPPDVKQRVKTDRSLGFTKILLRMVRRFMIHSTQDMRTYFIICARRAVEAVKLIDDGEDSFDTSQSTMPTLTFGVGYGEHGENRTEKGMGLWSGYQEEINWGLMMLREVDGQMFAELDSLVRLE